MKRHAKQLAKANPVKAPTIAPTPAPVATTMIVDESKASKKRAKKEANERRQSGDFPPAESVRIDDLVSQEDEEGESKVDRKVRFGKPQSKGEQCRYFHIHTYRRKH